MAPFLGWFVGVVLSVHKILSCLGCSGQLSKTVFILIVYFHPSTWASGQAVVQGHLSLFVCLRCKLSTDKLTQAGCYLLFSLLLDCFPSLVQVESCLCQLFETKATSMSMGFFRIIPYTIGLEQRFTVIYLICFLKQIVTAENVSAITCFQKFNEISTKDRKVFHFFFKITSCTMFKLKNKTFQGAFTKRYLHYSTNVSYYMILFRDCSLII